MAPLGKSVAFGLFLPLLQYAVSGLIRNLPTDLATYKPYILYSTLGLAFTAGLFLAKKEIGHSLKADHTPSGFGIIACVSGVIAAISLGYYGSKFFSFFADFFKISEILRQASLNPLDFGIRNDASYFYQIFVVLLIPTLEEIWYRELTFTQARQVLGITFGILVSTLLFALSHFGAFPDLFSFSTALPSFFLSGAMLGVIRINHGLSYSILAHCFLNYLGLNIHTIEIKSSWTILSVAFASSAIFGGISFQRLRRN